MATGAPHASLRMRIEIDPRVLAEPRWPSGVSAQSFALSDGKRLHALLVDGYRRGGGSVQLFEGWLPEMTSDPEFDPALWVLADADGVLAGAILCWTSGFVKDLVVAEPWRGRGLGEALVRRALQLFADRGIGTVELKVHADNASAIELYERVGLRVVERLDG
jgi:ribosomal protein S18 acetylase RimI-like enzyme